MSCRMNLQYTCTYLAEMLDADAACSNFTIFTTKILKSSQHETLEHDEACHKNILRIVDSYLKFGDSDVNSDSELLSRVWRLGC